MAAQKEGDGLSRRDLVFRKPRYLLFRPSPQLAQVGQVLEKIGQDPSLLVKVADVGIRNVAKIAEIFPSSTTQTDGTSEPSTETLSPSSTVAFSQAFDHIKGMSWNKGIHLRDNGIIMGESGYQGIDAVIDLAATNSSLTSDCRMSVYRAANRFGKVQETIDLYTKPILLTPHFYAQNAEYKRRYGINPSSDLEEADKLVARGNCWGYVRWSEMQVAVAHARAGSDGYQKLLDTISQDSRVKTDGHSMAWLVRTAAECGDFNRAWEYLHNSTVTGRLWFVAEDTGWEFVRQGQYKEAAAVAEYGLAHTQKRMDFGTDFRPEERTGSDWDVELHAILAVAKAKSSLFGRSDLSALKDVVQRKGIHWVDWLENNLAFAKAKRLTGQKNVYGDIEAELDKEEQDTAITHEYHNDQLLYSYGNVIQIQAEVGDGQEAYKTFLRMDRMFPITDITPPQKKERVLSAKANALTRIGKAQAIKEGKYH